MEAPDRRGDRTAWADGLSPAGVWQEFALLSAIPRHSKHEDAARDHVLARLAASGIAARVDRAGNVVADVPASPGAEETPTVVLQAHLDIVCEADAGAGTDPAVDGVFPRAAGDWVAASGTTLGADDGIGVATALALAADASGDAGEASFIRPPLQLLFTVDEEEDFGGAAGVDPALVTGRILLNLDAEDEREVIIGSAGGSRVIIRMAAEWQPSPSSGRAVRLRVSGLEGGHSGQQIDDNHMNAVKALAHTLAIAFDRLGDDATGEVGVAALRGGRADNAIPREAEAALLVGDAGLAALQEAAHDVEARVRAWRAEVDDEAQVEVVEGEGRPERVLAHAMARRVVDLLVALPSGVIAMDEQLPGTVRTSANLGIVASDADGVTITSAPRSSRESDLDALHSRYASYARLAGASVEVTSRYPAWAPDFGNRLLDVVRAAYREVHGGDPTVTAVHAGLEAGELASHLPGLLAVSIGPTVLGAHGPGERLEIASVGRFDAMVRGILARLALRA